MQEVAKDRDVLAPPRTNEREEAEEMRQRSFPTTTRVEEWQIQVKVPQTKQPLLVNACCRSESASGADSWTSLPLSLVLIRKEDAASMVELRIPPSPPAFGNGSAPSSHEDVTS